MVYQCPKCPSKFTQTIDVQSHYQEIHSVQKPIETSENYVKVYKIQKPSTGKLLVHTSNFQENDAIKPLYTTVKPQVDDSKTEIDIKIEIKQEPVEESEEIVGIWLQGFKQNSNFTYF